MEYPSGFQILPSCVNLLKKKKRETTEAEDLSSTQKNCMCLSYPRETLGLCLAYLRNFSHQS